MLVLSKKRIKILISSVLVGLLVFTFQVAQKDKNINVEETVATPASGKTVIIDARTWKT